MKNLIISFVVVLFIYVAIVAATCPANNVYSVPAYSFSLPSYTLTFDDQGWSTDVPSTLETPLVFTSGQLSVTVSGTNCQIQKTLATLSEETTWLGSAKWDGGNENETPGYFMTTTDENSTCTFEFDAPVSQIMVRAMCGYYVLGEFRLYDSTGLEIGCSVIGNVAGENIYLGFGWTGFKQIAKLEYTGGLFAIDNIQVRFGCDEGEYWNGLKCADYDECNFGECNENANCISPNNVVECSCKLGFYGDGIGPEGCSVLEGCPQEVVCPASTYCYNDNGNFTCYCDDYYFEENYGSPLDNITCVDRDECSRSLEEGYPCVPEATCNNTYGGYECNCPAGYTGTGIIWGGDCSLINLCQPSGACSQYATCESYNGLTLNCTCQTGYEGDGVGADGCTAVTPPDAPVAPVAPVAVQSPQSSNTPTNNNTTPKGLGVSSGIGSAELCNKHVVLLGAVVVSALALWC
jgi:hypothetical protein